MEDIHRVQELLYIQIKALQALNKNESPNKNRKVIRQSHQQLACFFLDLSIIPPASINQWLEIHTKPLLDWLPEKYSELPINFESALYDLEINEISEQAYWFLKYTGNPRDYQTKPVLEVISYCASYPVPYQKGYVTFRKILADKKFAVLSENGLEKLLDSIEDLFIKKQLEQCYERLENWREYRVCPNCGYTLHFKNGNWQCGKYNVCGKISGTRFSNWNFVNPKPFNFKDEEKTYRLKHGVHSSVLVPGISELRIFSRLTSIYQVELYPNIDRDGDIRVILENEVIDFDVKSYRSPDGLAFQIQENLQKNENGHLPIYIVPYEYTASWRPGYIKRVKSFFANEDGIQILSESKLANFLREKAEK
ncbi:restriction endonuclease-related protein [Risungbinella massiliensis]|uniref:restriction endonuclease-related protein n=1 Tax=Risungbinella massiliensis TaxID=1329796 RepID=UPI0005CBCB81|nr:hypothetical protein [Risungbinella massiliensis]